MYRKPGGTSDHRLRAGCCSWACSSCCSAAGGYNAPSTPKTRLLLVLLALAVPITSLFFGLQLPVQGSLPPPGLPVEPVGPALMFFAAVPWMLAGGLFGPLPAALLGAAAGIFQALWDTHNPFTPLVIALLAILFSVAVRQRYRTRIYAWPRQPALAALLLAVIYPLIDLFATLLFADGGLAARLRTTLRRAWAMPAWRWQASC